jgi:predicted transposase YdaD
MAKPYDAILKEMVETEPAGWLPLVRRPPAPVTVIDADVSTSVSGAVDKVLRVHANPEYLLHLDFQSGHDSAKLPPRLRLYNDVLDDRHGLLVWSEAFILRPEADSPQLTGALTRRPPDGALTHDFRYVITRVWRLPVEALLTGGLGTLPLAPVSDVEQSALPVVIRRMKARLRRAESARELWAATYVLLGLRYAPGVAETLLRGIVTMEESTTYQAILARGRDEGEHEGALKAARKILLRLGAKHLGPADATTTAAVQAIADVQLLEQLAERTDEAKSWQELLGAHGPRRKRKL